MPVKLPRISEKLDRLRQAARSLHGSGFTDEAEELMRISRGEVKIKPDNKLFGMTPSEIDAAKVCTRKQRLILAARDVELEKYGETENDYSDARDRELKGNCRWPGGKKKTDAIKEIAKKHNLSASSLKQHIGKSKDKLENPFFNHDFQSPDWKPDNPKLFHQTVKK